MFFTGNLENSESKHSHTVGTEHFLKSVVITNKQHFMFLSLHYLFFIFTLLTKISTTFLIIVKIIRKIEIPHPPTHIKINNFPIPPSSLKFVIIFRIFKQTCKIDMAIKICLIKINRLNYIDHMFCARLNKQCILQIIKKKKLNNFYV